MGRARFLLCTGFIVFRRFFVGDQTQTSTWPNHNRDFESRNLGCLFAKSCWNINVCVGFKGNIEYTKKGTTSAMECANVAAFTFAMRQIRLCLLCKFISLEVMVINLFAILGVFFVGLGK